MLLKFDLTGKRFGRLLVRREMGRKKINGAIIWLCDCDCGKQVKVPGISLRRLHGTRSCGCLKRENAGRMGRKIKLRHGHGRRGRTSLTYNSWLAMKGRCTDPEHKSFKNYGGRGIKVCDRWLYSFDNFLADMGIKPKGLTLDRINNNGNYEPRNCRWATWVQQNNNKRNQHQASV